MGQYFRSRATSTDGEEGTSRSIGHNMFEPDLRNFRTFLHFMCLASAQIMFTGANRRSLAAVALFTSRPTTTTTTRKGEGEGGGKNVRSRGGEEIIFPPSSARSSRLSIEMFAFDRIFRETSHFLSAVRQSTSLEARSSLKSLFASHFSDFCRNFQRFPRLSHQTIVHSARCTSSARVLCEKCLF